MSGSLCCYAHGHNGQRAGEILLPANSVFQFLGLNLLGWSHTATTNGEGKKKKEIQHVNDVKTLHLSRKAVD